MSKHRLDEAVVNKNVPPAKKPTFSGHWSNGLYAAIEDKSLHVYSDEYMVVIKDKYPKSKYHYLVLPREKIANLKSLSKDHLPLLRKMHEQAQKLAEGADVKTFRFGYHAVPSMGLLHLHAISQDFDSPSLKTKKHWNSFTTDYFVDSEKLIEMLEKTGMVECMTDRNNLLSKDLVCHVCKCPQKNMPTLKQHIKGCFKDVK